MSKVLVQARDLHKEYLLAANALGRGGERIKAVDGVDLAVAREEICGLVGESGSGKTTLGKLLAGLERPTAGEVLYRGRDAAARRRPIGFVFQDPFSSLNPRLSVGAAIAEPLLLHGLVERRQLRERVAALLADVGLGPRDADRYPHEFSGGQRQRLGLARALAAEPEFMVCDEPTSSLDLSVAAGVLNLLLRVQARRRLSYLYISHDLRAVAYLSGRLAVMYRGKIVETGTRQKVYNNPHHPYTVSLWRGVIQLGKSRGRERGVRRRRDVAANGGCAYYRFCPRARRPCATEAPSLRLAERDHYSACFFD